MNLANTVVFALAVLMVAAATAATRAHAAEPGTFPCNGMLQFGDTPADPAINLQGGSGKVVSVPDPKHAGESVDQVQISWDGGLADKGVECIWLTRKGPGESDFSGEATAILPADATSYTDSPQGATGEYCYRIIPVSQTAPAEPTDICVDVQHPTTIRTDEGPGSLASPTNAPSTEATQPAPAPNAPDTGSGTAATDDSRLIWISGGLSLVLATLLWVAWFGQRERYG